MNHIMGPKTGLAMVATLSICALIGACTAAQGARVYSATEAAQATACLLAKSELASTPEAALVACELAPDLIDIAKLLFPIGQARAAAKRAAMHATRDQFGTVILVGAVPNPREMFQ